MVYRKGVKCSPLHPSQTKKTPSTNIPRKSGKNFRGDVFNPFLRAHSLFLSARGNDKKGDPLCHWGRPFFSHGLQLAMRDEAMLSLFLGTTALIFSLSGESSSLSNFSENLFHSDGIGIADAGRVSRKTWHNTLSLWQPPSREVRPLYRPRPYTRHL